MSSSQVVILAGGLGTRLRPITEKIPKPLVEVAGEPFLHWQLSEVALQGITDVVLLVAYLGEQIEQTFGTGEKLGLKIKYVYEKQPMGTGGALKNAFSVLADEFILLNGDSFLSAPLLEMLQTLRKSDNEALMAVYDNEDPTPVPLNIEMNGDLVVRYQRDGGEASGCTHVDAGVYAIRKKVLLRTEREKFQLEELWPDLIGESKLVAYPVDERFYDIGTPERIKEFEEIVGDYF
jgi:N-acetyl-alpha-D-muramate 1-phosphate uridylyltransferase